MKKIPNPWHDPTYVTLSLMGGGAALEGPLGRDTGLHGGAFMGAFLGLGRSNWRARKGKNTD